MQPTDIQTLISRLPPGARFLYVEMPPGGSTTAIHTDESRAAATGEEGGRRAAVVTWPRNGPAKVTLGSIEERLDALRRTHGSDAALKPREWSSLVGLTRREIERAIRHGAMTASPKGDGKDHAAAVVSIDAMEAYLSTVSAVERNAMDPPRWWEVVRRDGAGRRARRPTEPDATGDE